MNYLLRVKKMMVKKIIVPSSKFFYRKILYKKINELNEGISATQLEYHQIMEIRRFYEDYGIKKINTSWHKFYTACNGFFSPCYIPETLFYTEIEPILNDKNYKTALSDKNLLDILFSGVRQPITIIKNIGGVFLSDNRIISRKQAIKLCSIDEKMIIKPSVDSGGGKNVRVINFDKVVYSDTSFHNLFDSYNGNFIVQKWIEQHPLMSQLNPTSLNTFRVLSLMDGNEVHVLSTIVRMGRNGAITDNSTSGGISCGISEEGNLNKIGFSSKGKIFHKTDNGLKFEDIKLPFMSSIREEIKLIHQRVPYFKVVSWDLAIDSSAQVVLIELNVWGQDINFHQWNNGPILSKLLKVRYQDTEN